MFGLFGNKKKDEKLADELTGLASILRADIVDLLFNHQFTYAEVDILKAFSMPTAIIYYHIRPHFSQNRTNKIIDLLEQESFNYTFAMHLRERLKSAEEIKIARDDFRKQTDQFLIGVPNMLENRDHKISSMLDNASIDEIFAYVMMLACIGGKPAFADTKYIWSNYKEFGRKIKEFRASVDKITHSYK